MRELKSVISDETLKKATAEADQAIRDSLPAPAECEHEFSPSFQRKMRRTFRKAKYPVIYKLPKYAACFVLVVVLASSTWLTVDAEARAAFFAWVREQYETFIEYRFVGDTTQNDKSKQYELTQLPDGFFETNRMESKGNAVVIYQNGSGKTIQFTYSQGDDSISLYYVYMFLFSRLGGSRKREDLANDLIYKVQANEDFLIQSSLIMKRLYWHTQAFRTRCAK
jgi:hypothetical protein